MSGLASFTEFEGSSPSAAQLRQYAAPTGALSQLQFSGSPYIDAPQPGAPRYVGVNTPQGKRYFIPAYGDGQSVTPWKNWSDLSVWSPAVEDLPFVSAPQLSDFVKGQPYGENLGSYSGYGWLSKDDQFPSWHSYQGYNNDDDFDLGTLLAIGGLGLGVSGLFGFNPFSGLGELFGGLGGGAGAAGEIAALTGSGVPIGGALGTGATASSGLGSLIDLPWGVNQQGGGMDFFNTDSLWGNSGSGGVDNLFGDWNIPSGSFSTTGPASGAFPGYDFGLGYPVGGDLVTNLAGGGLTNPASWLDNLKLKVPGLSQVIDRLTGSNSTSSGQGSYSFPFGDVLGGILEAYGAKNQQGDLMSLMDKSLGYIDPFHDQRPQYQTQFRNLTQNPSNFFKDPAVSSMMDLADETTSRKLASQGYNMSGNFASEIAKTRANEMFKNYLPYSDMIGTAAGYKLSPGNVGAATGIGQAAAGQGQQALGGLGSAFNSAMTGEQPSYLDQIFGKQKNQNLAQLFMSGLS